jgi:hypothetical protein
MKTIKPLQNKRGTVRLLIKPLTSRVRLYQNTVIAILFAGTVVQSGAQIYTPAIRDTSLQINLSGGLSDWTIDGVNQLNQQSFYYSVGSGPVYSIDNIASWSTPTIATNLGKTQITLNETYASSTISVGTKYVLGSGLPGSGQATLGQMLTINNLSGTAQVFHFYQYSDFDLGGVLGNQNVVFSSNGSGQEYQVVQTGLTGAILTGLLTGVSGGSSYTYEVQAGYSDGTQFGLGNGNSAPLLNNTLTAGPGNVDYAYEWDLNLTASGSGSSIIISESQAVAPEPSSVALVASGMLALALLYRRRQGGQRNCRSC